MKDRRFLLEVNERIEEELESLIALRAILRTHTEEHHVSRAYRNIDDRRAPREMFLAQQPSRGEHTAFRIYGNRTIARSRGDFERGAVLEPYRNLARQA